MQKLVIKSKKSLKKIDDKAREILLIFKREKISKKELLVLHLFFEKNARIFHNTLNLDDTLIFNNLLIKHRRSSKEILGFNKDFSKIEKIIRKVWEKYIKNNFGECGNYFGAITIIISKEFLIKRKHKNIESECNLFLKNKKINNIPIDLTSFYLTTFFMSECKHAYETQKEKIIKRIPLLKKWSLSIPKETYNKNKGDVINQKKILLITLSFIRKERIIRDFIGILSNEEVINAEDIFNIKIGKSP